MRLLAHPLVSYILPLVLLGLCLPVSRSQISPAYEIKTLDSFSSQFFSQVSTWNFTSIRVTPYNCSSIMLLSFLSNETVTTSKIFTNMPTHKMVSFAFTFYAITSSPSLGSTSIVSIRINNSTVMEIQFQLSDFSSSVDCYPNRSFVKRRIYGRFNHTNETNLNFMLTFEASTNFQSYGFTDLILYFSKDFRDPFAPCIYNASTTTFSRCPSTLVCDASCKTCFGDTSSQCYECAPGYSFDGTICIKCDPSCVTCTGTAKNQCLTCQSGYYLFNNNTCLQTCLPPLVSDASGNVSFCSLPSVSAPYPASGYFYWNNTFQQTCLSPLQTEEIGGSGIRFCYSPCGSNSYLYWNGTCLNTCNSPLYIAKTQSGSKFCYSNCSSSTGSFISQTGSCLSSCEPPQRIDNQNMLGSFCLPPCDNPLMYFHEDSSQCKYECQQRATLDPKGYLVCPPSSTILPTPTPFSSLNSSSPNTSLPQIITSSGLLFDSVFLAPLEPGTVTFVALVKLMRYVRYIDSRMPPRLERLSVSKGRTVLSLQSGPEVTDTIYSWFNKQVTTPIIEKHRLHSRFLANFGGEIFVFLISISLALFFTTLRFIFSKLEWTHTHLVFQKLETLTRWNLCLMLFGSYLDDIILFSSFEFTTTTFETTSTYLSFFGCLFLLAASLGFLVVTFLTVRRVGIIKHLSSKAKTPDIPDQSLTKYSSRQVFFHGFSDIIRINQFFYLFYVLRSALPIIFAMILLNAPIVHAAFQVTFSLIVVTYILCVRPLKKKINLFQLIVTEITVFALNICVLSVTILDSQGQNNTPRYELLGDIIILGNVALNLFVLVILVIKVILTISEITILFKKSPAQAWISCIHLLVIPLQQGAFGFEELLGDIDPTQPGFPKHNKVLNNSSISPIGSTNRSEFMSPNSKKGFGQAVTVKNIAPVNFSTPEVDAEKSLNLDHSGDTSGTERLGQSSVRLLVHSNSGQTQEQLRSISGINNHKDEIVSSSKYNKKISTIFGKVANPDGDKQAIRASNHYPVDLSQYNSQIPITGSFPIPSTIKVNQRRDNSQFYSQ